MTEHHDVLESLNKHVPIQEKLIATHESVKKIFPFVARIAVAIYDPETNILKTFLHSSGVDNPLENYQALLDDAPSLKKILKKGLPRVINNQLTFEDSSNTHTRRIGRQGYAASYTLPMFNNGVFTGFIFFNSYDRDVFSDLVLSQLDVYGHMISLLVINELSSAQTLTAAVQTTGHITHARDPETGSHLDRMSRYSRLIASELATLHELDDAYIEHIFMFSPLHDIGKIAIPDQILFKPGELDREECEIMKTHSRKGREMIDQLIDNFGLDRFEYIDVLRNIAEHHHEAVNGSGYPKGIMGADIPLEARIVAVADVFDALTSKRPYKEAWCNEDAIKALEQMSGETLDRDCVNALLANIEQVEQIQKQFDEDNFG
ncbi:MAG: HD domain-containing protein [Gammaproteobacteria bacterium]|nr:HD domain-containing protein [Gammaproteobacteria bacterium]